ncbi:MAG: hypothetical protein ACXWLX_14640, partial [Rhizomicrobium sp.]
CLLLGGCWQSNGSLYGKINTVTPFRAGAITQTGGKQAAQNFDLTLAADGSYRMIGSDKGTDDFGEGFNLRFFALAGLPANIYAYEAVSLSHCGRPSGCDPFKADNPRYYGLIRTKLDGADEIRPDCKEDAAITAPAGIKEDDGVCTFQSRPLLEKSLLALAASGKKAEHLYRFH